MGNLFFDEPHIKQGSGSVAWCPFKVGDVIRWDVQPGLWYEILSMRPEGENFMRWSLKGVRSLHPNFNHYVGQVFDNYQCSRVTIDGVSAVPESELQAWRVSNG